MPTKETMKSVQQVHWLLANAGRLEIVRALSAGPMGVSALAEKLDASMSTTSQNLTALHRGGLVEFEKNGTARAYRLAEPTHPIVSATLAILEG